MFASINRCRDTSRATDLPLSSCADPLVMRNSLRSLNSGSQFKCGGNGLELHECRGQVLNDLPGDDLRGREVVQVLQVTLTYDWSKVTDKAILQKVTFPLVPR